MYGNTSDGSLEGLVKFVLAIVALVIGYVVVSSAINYIKLGNLPLTRHATTSHAEQNWNATTISQYMDERCDPDSCVSGDVTIYFCEYDKQPKYSLVLFVGRSVERIITGYMTETSRVPKLCTK